MALRHHHLALADVIGLGWRRRVLHQAEDLLGTSRGTVRLAIPDVTSEGDAGRAVRRPRGGSATVWNQRGRPVVHIESDQSELHLMPSTYPPEPSTAAIVLNQVHWFFMSFPIVCFTLALLTDIAYWRTSFLMWHDFSSWLLFAGLVGGAIALIAGLVGLLLRSHILPWYYWLGLVAVLALALINSLIHAGDGWTAIVPRGLALSAVTVVVMLATAWIGRSTVSSGGRQRHA